jgi:hypothetical protein
MAGARDRSIHDDSIPSTRRVSPGAVFARESIRAMAPRARR